LSPRRTAPSAAAVRTDPDPTQRPPRSSAATTHSPASGTLAAAASLKHAIRRAQLRPRDFASSSPPAARPADDALIASSRLRGWNPDE
jgi:hypothetical protein